jgi:BASS family bile acid:Na+ symporter
MLRDLLNIVVITFAVTSMFAVGVSYSLRRIVTPLRNVRLVALGLISNFVLVPAWAVLVTWALHLDDPYKVGILLVSTAAGAPFLVKLVAAADGDVAFAGSLLVLLLPVTVVYMPLVVPLITSARNIDPLAIASPLILTNLLPLAVGVAVFATLPRVAERVRPVLGPISTAALVALLVLTVAANARDLVDVLGQRAIIAALLLVVGAFAIGFALGVPDHHRDEIGLATAQRNVAAATIVATQTIGNPDTVVTVVVTSTVAMAVLFPLTTQLKKRFGAAAMSQRAQAETSDHVTDRRNQRSR